MMKKFDTTYLFFLNMTLKVKQTIAKIIPIPAIISYITTNAILFVAIPITGNPS